MAAAGIGPEAFAGRDLVTGQDVREYLEPAAKPGPPAGQSATASGASAARSAASATKTAPATLPVDPAKAIVQKLQSAKRREIEYLSDVQSTGLVR